MPDAVAADGALGRCAVIADLPINLDHVGPGRGNVGGPSGDAGNVAAVIHGHD